MTTNREKLTELRKYLRAGGYDFVVTRYEGDVVHLNLYMGDD